MVRYEIQIKKGTKIAELYDVIEELDYTVSALRGILSSMDDMIWIDLPKSRAHQLTPTDIEDMYYCLEVINKPSLLKKVVKNSSGVAVGALYMAMAIFDVSTAILLGKLKKVKWYFTADDSTELY